MLGNVSVEIAVIVKEKVTSIALLEQLQTPPTYYVA